MRPAAGRVAELTDRMTRMATPAGKPARGVRNAVISLATEVPAVRRTIAFTLTELGCR